MSNSTFSFGSPDRALPGEVVSEQSSPQPAEGSDAASSHAESEGIHLVEEQTIIYSTPSAATPVSGSGACDHGVSC